MDVPWIYLSNSVIGRTGKCQNLTLFLRTTNAFEGARLREKTGRIIDRSDAAKDGEMSNSFTSDGVDMTDGQREMACRLM